MLRSTVGAKHDGGARFTHGGWGSGECREEEEEEEVWDCGRVNLVRIASVEERS